MYIGQLSELVIVQILGLLLDLGDFAATLSESVHMLESIFFTPLILLERLRRHDMQGGPFQRRQLSASAKQIFW